MLTHGEREKTRTTFYKALFGLLFPPPAPQLRLVPSDYSDYPSMDSKKAERLGGQFAACLATSLTSAIAVNAWSSNSPALITLFENESYLEDFFIVVGTHLLGSALWGAAARALAGAMLTLADVGR